jgi:cytochrome c peroxidase
MRGKTLRFVLAAAVLVAGALALTTLSRETQTQRMLVGDTAHGPARLSKAEHDRVLHAAAAFTASTPHDELVAEGRKLFRDPAMFEDGESCQSCHTEGSATSSLGPIPHPRSDITNDFTGPRDAPALWGIAKTAPYFWNGDVLTLQDAASTAVLNHFDDFVGVNGVGTCVATNGKVDGPRTPACLAKDAQFGAAIAAYLSQLDPPVTRFDQGTLTAQAQAGETLFQGKGGCIACHGGPQFTDNLIHNTGVPKTSPQDTDVGAGPPPRPPACNENPVPAGCEVLNAPGPFINTPQLRDVKNTAPYMHNGVFKTLKQVVEFYNNTSLLSPMNLTPTEVDDLVAYLESL